MHETERRLEGRVAIVTGSGGTNEGLSIGRAIAVTLAQHGACVVVADRDAEAADVTVSDIAGRGGKAAAAIADLTEEAGCREVVEQAVSQWGKLDILVNNLGFTGSGGKVADIEVSDWDWVLDLNLKTTLLMSKHAIGAMNGGGAIVNVSSLSATRPGAATAYAVAKGAVETLTRAAALQYGPD